MGRIITQEQQTSLLRDIVPEIHERSKIEKLAIIAAYASIVGVISERNLINFLNFAGIGGARDEEMVYHLLRYYISSSIIKVKDEKKGFIQKIVDNGTPLQPSDQEAAYITRENIKRMRRKYLLNEL